MTVAQGLKKFSLFKSFEDAELEQLYPLLEICNFPPETKIIQEGDRADDFYLIDKGAVGVLKGEVNIAWMEEGDYFGEMAILGERVRDASVLTLSPCVLFKVSRVVFEKYLLPRLNVVLDLAKTLDKRLQQHNHLVVTQYESLKALYDETKKNEDFFRFLNEAVHDAMIVFENNEVLFSSRKVNDLLGMSPVPQTSLSSLFRFLSPDSVLEVMHAINYGLEQTYEVEGIRANNEKFPLELRPRMVNFEGRQLRVCLFRDLTEQKNRELLIENQKAQMTQSAKMALLGEMASGIAHELNNPLSIIDGFAKILEKHAENPEGKSKDIKKIADTILQMTERISKIIMGLRSFARDGSKDDFEYAPLSKMIRETLDFIKVKKMKMTVDVIVENLSPDLGVECRGVQIEEVILNLVSNSFDAVSELPERWVKISVDEFPEYVCLYITDSGKGIPQNILAKIFEPFYTTKPVGKGTGLGMSISKKIVEDHGGTLKYNALSPHTQFIITLPKRQNQKQAKAS